jgi:hypothetical protein
MQTIQLRLSWSGTSCSPRALRSISPWPEKELTRSIIAAAISVHNELGPGLLENVYEECLCGRVVVEMKAIANVAPGHEAVMLTYRRLSGCKIGLLINFHSATLKDGIQQYVWKYDESSQIAEA